MAHQQTTADVDQAVGERIHLLIWKARLQQKDIAKTLGMDPAALTRRLRGTTPWKIGELLAVAQILGVTLDELIPPHDELGAPPGVSSDNAPAESRCTVPLAEPMPYLLAHVA